MTPRRPGAKRGRPPVPPAERRDHDIRVPVTEAERAILLAWAERENRPIAELVRAAALRRARRVERQS